MHSLMAASAASVSSCSAKSLAFVSQSLSCWRREGSMGLLCVVSTTFPRCKRHFLRAWRTVPVAHNLSTFIRTRIEHQFEDSVVRSNHGKNKKHKKCKRKRGNLWELFLKGIGDWPRFHLHYRGNCLPCRSSRQYGQVRIGADKCG